MGQIFFSLFLLHLFQTCVGVFNSPQAISGAPTRSETISVPLSEVNRVGKYAAAFYCDLIGSDCEEWKETLKTYSRIDQPETNTKAIVGVLKGETEAFVAFRGTSGLQDTLLDLTTISTQGGRIKFHMGLYVATMSIYEEVVRKLQRYVDRFPGISRILVTGASLGGAMSAISIFNFHYMDTFSPNMTYTMVTFGQPRVGNRDYAEYMNHLGIPMARVVARGDIVPHLPSTSVLGLPLLGSTFHHHHQEIWIEDEEMKKVHFCSMKVLEDKNCSNSRRDNYNFQDHFLYVDYFGIMNEKFGKSNQELKYDKEKKNDVYTSPRR